MRSQLHSLRHRGNKVSVPKDMDLPSKLVFKKTGGFIAHLLVHSLQYVSMCQTAVL